MKKILIAVLVLLGAASCNNVQKGQATPEQIAIDSLKTVIADQDSLMSAVFQSLEQVIANMQTIKQREGLINQTVIAEQGRLGASAAATISNDVAAIDSLLQRNKRTIQSLQGYVGALKKSKAQVENLEALVGKLNSQISASDAQIAQLRSDLENRNVEISTLNTAVTGLTEQRTQLQTEVQAQGDQLNTAYYIVGSKKSLISNNIVYASGFIGRTLKINENRSLDPFVRIDVRKFSQLQVEGRKPFLVSVHPEGSYEWRAQGEDLSTLVILDSGKFWEMTKVLVVAYK